MLVHLIHDLLPRLPSAVRARRRLALRQLLEQVKRPLRKLARILSSWNLARRVFRLFRHQLQIFGLSGGRIWKSVVKLFASIRFDLLAKMVRKIAE